MTDRTPPPPPDNTTDPWESVPPPRAYDPIVPRFLAMHERSYRRQKGLPWDQEYPRFVGAGIWIPPKDAPPGRLERALVSWDKYIRDRNAWWYPCYCVGGPGLWSYWDTPPFDRTACSCKGYVRAYDQMAEAFGRVVQLAGWDPPPVPWPPPPITGDPDAVREALKELAGNLTDPDRVVGRARREQVEGFASRLEEPPEKEREAVKEILQRYRQERPKRESFATIATILNRKESPELNRKKKEKDGKGWNKNMVKDRWYRWKDWTPKP